MHKHDKSQTENKAGEAKVTIPFSFLSKNNLEKNVMLIIIIIVIITIIFSIIIVNMIKAKHGENALALILDV